MKYFHPKPGRAETVFFRFSDIDPSKRQGCLRRLVGILRKRWHYHQLVRDLAALPTHVLVDLGIAPVDIRGAVWRLTCKKTDDACTASILARLVPREYRNNREQTA